MKMPIVLWKGAAEPQPASIENLCGEESEQSFEVTLQMVPRNCRLENYKKIKVPSFSVTGEIVAYASPDSTFAVTKKFIDAAKKNIVIGIYDFTASYIADLLKDAMARGVKVTLMLDTDHVKGEDELFQDLAESGATCVPAPSCASKRVHYFRSSHEKVIVIDGETCLIQSGNYSKNSIPLNVEDGKFNGHFRTGNRDMGIAVRSIKLANFLAKVLASDMKLELNVPERLELAYEAIPPMLIETMPAKRPAKLFPSKAFKLTNPLRVQPVLSPDNYMNRIPQMLRTANSSVLIQQQYIHSADEPVAELLQAIKDARGRNKRFDVRILLGKLFDDKALKKEKENLKNIANKYDLTIGRNIRYADTTRLVHCHNKLVIVDAKTVLVSSQNWSRAAVLENREVGLLFQHKGVAGYFTEIFEEDWKVGQKRLPKTIKSQHATLELLKKGGFIEVAAADYQQL
jgi:phosphatidylserine/phosphatidylglycerophosphate/cardiolipin synthase-like enzyme